MSDTYICPKCRKGYKWCECGTQMNVIVGNVSVLYTVPDNPKREVPPDGR